MMKIVLPALLVLTFAACQPAAETPASPEADAAPETPPAAEATTDTAAATIAIRNAKTPLPGVLTGGQPTVEQIEEAAAAGYRTVVNLRTPGEEGSWDEAPKVEELGMRYVSIPVAGAEDLNLENSRQLFDILESSDNYPVMVHCGSGNRIGALFALQAFHVDGKDAEEALAVGREAGLTRLEETVRGLLEGDGESSGSP